MIKKISQKVYTTLANDSTLQGMLPDVKDSSNIWELRMPNPATDAKFPIIVFRVRTGIPLLSVSSLNAFNWFVEIDIINNDGSMSDTMDIFERVYDLLHNQNMSSGEEKAYKCKLDFFDTSYDQNTLTNFILTRWQIWSMELPDSSTGQLS